ncbi:MAG: 16S rRNA (guanine(966)-N(2))-methyltransferase RsmD [Magnetococcales bacterium]|nr:16S rRNA (guanine(966)-N(2))-methyltransferase RsmD [Magnetococcales bacterium]
MRISGGYLRGRTVPSPGSSFTRPTTERIREAMFSMLATTVVDAHVLDLFAGCGLLGLEALSRGAQSAWFVEQHAPTARQLRQILTNFQLSDRADVINGPVDFPTLQRLHAQATLKTGQQMSFNLVLMDPPYGKGLAEASLAMLPKTGLLAPETVAVVEHEGEVAPSLFCQAPWRLWKSRRHGATAITLLFFEADSSMPNSSPFRDSATP